MGTASSEESPRAVGVSTVELLLVVEPNDEDVVLESTTVFVGSPTTTVAMGAPVVVAPATTGSGPVGTTEAAGTTGGATGGATGGTADGTGTGTVAGVVGGTVTRGAVATGATVTGGTVASGCVAGGGGVVTTAASPSGLSCALEVFAVPAQLENTTPRIVAVMAALREREVMGIEDSRTGEQVGAEARLTRSSDSAERLDKCRRRKGRRGPLVDKAADRDCR
jgi:hypothetical protein